MKKLQFALISLIIISSIGCSSTPVSEQEALTSPSIAEDKVEEKAEEVKISSSKPKKEKEEELPGIYFKNKQTNQKLRIDQWKYMGFGTEIPSWLVPALENDVKSIKNNVPELENKDVIVLVATGCNSDQAESALQSLEKPEGYELFDSFWVRAVPAKKNEQIDMSYISVAVYSKLIIES